MMKQATVIRARNNAFLNRALMEGNRRNMNDLEIFEGLVHAILNWHDEMFQRELDKRMNSVELLFPIEHITTETAVKK